MIKTSTIFTETFRVRAVTFIARIPVYNNSCYCYFKAIVLSLFSAKVGFGGRRGKKRGGYEGDKKKHKPIPEIFVRHRCQRHLLYMNRQYLLAETLVLILKATQGNLNYTIYLTKLRLLQKTFRPLSLVIDIKLKENLNQFICFLKLYPCK